MSHTEAERWTNTGEVEVHREVFGEAPEAEADEAPGATVYVPVSADTKARVERAATAAGLSINAWASQCLEKCAKDLPSPTLMA